MRAINMFASVLLLCAFVGCTSVHAEATYVSDCEHMNVGSAASAPAIGAFEGMFTPGSEISDLLCPRRAYVRLWCGRVRATGVVTNVLLNNSCFEGWCDDVAGNRSAAATECERIGWKRK